MWWLFLSLRIGSIGNGGDDSSNEKQGCSIHWIWFCQLIAQIINAIIQHRDTPPYSLFIVLVYGPLLFFTFFLSEIAGLWMATTFLNLPLNTQEQQQQQDQDQVIENNNNTNDDDKLTQGSLIESGGLVLWTLGGLTIPAKIKTLQQDVQIVALQFTILICMGILSFIFYLICTNGRIETSLTAGAINSELYTAVGLFANVFGQFVWIVVMSFFLHLLLPIYPLWGGRLFVGLIVQRNWEKLQAGTTTTRLDILQRIAKWSELIALVILVPLFGWSFYDITLDDNNGIGVFGFCNFLPLLISSGMRFWTLTKTRHDDEEFFKTHPYLGRYCVQTTLEQFKQNEGDNDKPIPVETLSDKELQEVI